LRGLETSAVTFVGNDVNDLGCMMRVGLSIAVVDAYPEVPAMARHRTLRRGGDSAVREVVRLDRKPARAGRCRWNAAKEDVMIWRTQ
jgi:3-deoxy-D-manno-octulosonate 8-phosphate phosphatase KdsC-like HAD superfamily phosphatase